MSDRRDARSTAPPGRKLSRRRWLIGCGGLAAAGAAGAVACDDRWDLQTPQVDVPLKGLGQALDGFRIAHLTDLHRGVYVSAAFVDRAVQAANAARPDLVVLTGDYVTHSTDFMRSCAESLAKLAAPYGRVAVLGNHDYWTSADEVTRELGGTAGLQVLKNRPILIFHGDAALAIAGLDDPVTLHHDFDAVLSGIEPDIPVVLPAHTPDIIEEAARRKVGLVLAGHTHGGQIVVPGFGPPVPNSRYGRRFVAGLRRLGDTAVYTNRGVGMAVLPVRFNCPPEVAIITLRSA
ncbi:MAG: metallophosphoesterase [Armatimonadetes bacterium]|nr:metallophosphoesterase [Armatimonadota bacterium]